MPNRGEAYRLEMKFNVGEGYELLKEIGEGSFGAVVLARHVETQRLVAIKKVDKLFFNVQDAKL